MTKTRFAVLGAMCAVLFAVFAVFSTENADATLPSTHTNQRWVKLRSYAYTDLQTDGGTKTITLPKVGAQWGDGFVIEETLIKERTQFVHTNNDGGAQTLTLDIGKGGALESYAKDVSLKQASGTVTLGSGTTSVKPRIYESDGVQPVITVTSGNVVDQLSRISAGALDVYVLVSNVPQ